MPVHSQLPPCPDEEPAEIKVMRTRFKSGSHNVEIEFVACAIDNNRGSSQSGGETCRMTRVRGSMCDTTASISFRHVSGSVSIEITLASTYGALMELSLSPDDLAAATGEL